ncbi:small multidrug resistance family-3 protein [Streptomyces sp. LBL]|nr:small multidrug resistance family-3 protein [Streptomyces sp. LBL]
MTALRVIKAAQWVGLTLEEPAELLEVGRPRHDRPVAGLQVRVAANLPEGVAKIADRATIRIASHRPGRENQRHGPPVVSPTMTVARSLALFVVAALFEIGGAWLVWQGIREHKGWIWIGAGVIALGLYGVVATWQHDDNFGRILAAYGGIFVAGSIAWGMVADGYRPDRYDVTGALVCLAGMAVIMYAPRSH